MAALMATDEQALSFYVDVRPDEFADLEVVASAAIAWSNAIRSAALALYPDDEIRITLIAAERGSSNWLAKIERSSVNNGAKRLKAGWKALPLVVRMGLGLAVVIPTTAIPTIDYWTGNDGFSEKQKEEIAEIVEKASRPPAVESSKRQMYATLQRDAKITGIGTGVPTGDNWKPPFTIPADRFAEADGLFDPQQELPQERVLHPILDVILIAPHLENAPRVWVFKQEGLPGTIRAIMKDKRFLAALDRKAVKEQFRANIPMRIRLSIRQRLVDGEWKVVRKGRLVDEVISPQIDP